MTNYSAIVPNYNDSKNIAASLESLKNQTVPFTEIVVIDDGSTDNSILIIESLIAGIPNTRLLRNEKNMGVVGTLNRGIREVKGDFLFLCSANDTYHAKMVEWCEEMLSVCPGVGMVSGNVAVWDEERGRYDYDMCLPLPQQRACYTPEQLVVHNRKVGVHFNGGANALRRDLVLEFGGLLPELKWHCDWFLNLMIAFRAGCAYVPENFSTCRLQGTKSYSSGRFDWSQEKEIIRAAILTLKRFPREAEMFKESALLPKYDLKAPRLMRDKDLRWFVTPLLKWRMVMHSLTYRMKYIIPRPVLMYFRPFFRI